MLGSTITTAPRRQGDGMDSESLLRQSVIPEAQSQKLPPRHTNLKNTTLSTSIDVDRLKKARFIPKEPVKGAVKPVLGADHGLHLNGGSQSKPQASELEAKSSCILEVNDDHMKLEDRTVEGDPQSLPEAEQLTKKLAELQKQLETQSKVNMDLKKLLVASMGDDLHHKVDSLVRTRAQLASEIGGYAEKIHEDCETLDMLSIQADMWRSKYTASRVLVDQLASAKEKYEDLHKEGKRVLKQLLQERSELNDSLRQTHRYLKLLRDSFDPRAAKQPPAIIPNILELARTNLLLADSIKFRLIPAMPVFHAALDAGIQNGTTPAEKLAFRLLTCEDKPEDKVGPVVPGRLPAELLSKYNRFHPHVRYDNITFNCCNRCKGDIEIV